jgi:hypothetical protein
VSDSHDAIDELLAAYVLRSLSGEDAVEADRLLTAHVPLCAACKQTLDAFQRVAGEIGLGAAAVQPPDTLLPALHRDMEARPRRRNTTRIIAVAASVVLVVGLGGVAATELLGDGRRTGTLAVGDLTDALAFATRTDARSDDIGPAREISAPGAQEFYLYSTDCPVPPDGYEYRVWLVSATETRYLGAFLPDANGDFVLHVGVDPTPWDQVLVTREPVEAEPSSPGPEAWPAAS